jgi:hypothetical protein
MDELIKSYTKAFSTASVLLDKMQRIYSALSDVSTEEDTREKAGTILADVVSLSGLATLLLIDINEIIKSGE